MSSSPPFPFMRPNVLAIMTRGLCESTATAAYPNAWFCAGSGFTGVMSLQAPLAGSNFQTAPSVIRLGPGEVP